MTSWSIGLQTSKDSWSQAGVEVPPSLYLFLLAGLFLILFWSRLAGLMQLHLNS